MAGSVYSSSNPEVLNFCLRRLDSSVVDAIIKANRKGINTPGLKDHLSRCEYIPVLSAIWGERDKKRRIEWLRANADFHAPLMLELAIAEFVASPTVETVAQVVIPLMRTAVFRIRQDARCLCNYSSEIKLEGRFRENYLEVLFRAVKKYNSDLNLLEVIKERKDEISSFTNKELQKLKVRTMLYPHTLPSPVWVSYYQGENQYAMIDSKDFNNARKFVAMQEF